MHAYTIVCTHTHTRTHACTHACTHARTHTRTHTHTHTHPTCSPAHHPHSVTPSPPHPSPPHWRPQRRGCEGVWLSRRAPPPPGGTAERHVQGGRGKIGMVTDNQPVMYMYTATTVSISKIGMATDNQPVSKTNLPQSCTCTCTQLRQCQLHTKATEAG